MDVLGCLRRIPLFADLSDADLARLAERCVLRRFGAGQLLFRAGDPGRGLYIVHAGSVRVFRTSEAGREQVLKTEGPGRLIGELPLFDGGPYPASAVTREPSELLFLARDDFEYLYRAHPGLADGIIRALGRRVRRLVQLTETIAFRDVAARLAMLLADYAERDGMPTSAGITLRLGRTHEELSFELGTARESVGRAFKQLRARRLVESGGRGTLLIKDVAKLRAAARGE
jgi:CRP/FNR family cyclic AMP-dependent transcriptional regulator